MIVFGLVFALACYIFKWGLGVKIGLVIALVGLLLLLVGTPAY